MTISRIAIMVNIVKMAIIAIMEKFYMTTDMVFMGVFSESSENADQLRKRFVNRPNRKEVMIKTNFSLDFGPFPLYF